MDTWREDTPRENSSGEGQTPNTRNEQEKEDTSALITFSDETAQTPPRSKTFSRVLFTLLSVGMLVVLLVSLIAVGYFGNKQREVTNFYKGYDTQSSGSCILYAKSLGQASDTVVLIKLHSYGPCAFVLFGLTSVSIAVVFFVVYLVVLTILGIKIVSLLRMLDLVVSFSAFLASFIISITITAGINQTCGIFNQKGSCSESRLVHVDGSDGELDFYNAITVAKNSSWVVTLYLLSMTLWNGFLMIICCLRNGRRK